jgi:hypothetical protein
MTTEQRADSDQTGREGIDPANPPTKHVGIDPELGPPVEGYGGKPGEQELTAPDSERTTGEVVDTDEVKPNRGRQS